MPACCWRPTAPVPRLCRRDRRSRLARCTHPDARTHWGGYPVQQRQVVPPLWVPTSKGTVFSESSLHIGMRFANHAHVVPRRMPMARNGATFTSSGLSPTINSSCCKYQPVQHTSALCRQRAVCVTLCTARCINASQRESGLQVHAPVGIAGHEGVLLMCWGICPPRCTLMLKCTRASSNSRTIARVLVLVLARS
jgi:hypothetical protein